MGEAQSQYDTNILQLKTSVKIKCSRSRKHTLALAHARGAQPPLHIAAIGQVRTPQARGRAGQVGASLPPRIRAARRLLARHPRPRGISAPLAVHRHIIGNSRHYGSVSRGDYEQPGNAPAKQHSQPLPLTASTHAGCRRWHAATHGHSQSTFDLHRRGTTEAIRKAMANEPSIDWLLENQDKIMHRYHQMGLDGKI